MAKRVKSVEITPARVRSRYLMQAVGLILLGGLLTASIFQGRRYAEARLLSAEQLPRVELKHVPAWMNADLQARIRQLATPVAPRSALDHDLLVDITHILQSEPWVKQVHQVRRLSQKSPGDTIEVHCDYRAPVALVEEEGYFWMVDIDGVKLPERYARGELASVAMDARMPRLRVITGVAADAPQAGEPWTGDDLRAGIELVRLLHDRPYAADVATIDVSNFAGRRNPQSAQIVLHTLSETEIRWGRPATGAKDFFVEVTPEQKLEHIQTIFDYLTRPDTGRRVRYPWYDIRREKILVDAGAENRHATLEP
jgi:hypothetical protein